MDIIKVHSEAGKILADLKDTNLKPDEKIAVLRSAASIIEQVIASEVFTVTLANLFQKK